ncbi:MAG: GxxExxY protein [Nitrospinae bacterium]|nr:GxxExxY protein [Nitrospinota bacterium]MBI3814929.1 GxxExxY protein [Nitrospinota bacterium]
MQDKTQRHGDTEKPIYYNEELTDHEAQMLTYLRLSKIKVGLIINFYTGALKDGVKRLVL